MDPDRLRARCRELLVRADNLIKNAPAGDDPRPAVRRAAALYEEAREAARAAGAGDLVRLAELRLADLERRCPADPPPAAPPPHGSPL